jgi:phenylalanyl-tRNA synthetase alpha chain
MSAEIFAKVQQLVEEITNTTPKTKDEVEQFRIRFLGSKNILKPLFGEIAAVEPARKKEYGQLVNAAKTQAEEKLEVLLATLESETAVLENASIDLTAPAEPLSMGSRHPVSIVMNRIIDIFGRIGFTVADGPEIETDWYNFTAMNTPEDHPARDMQDTFYLQDKNLRVSTQWLLRTHTSPVQARIMEKQKPPIRIIAPGRVYRNETISARSHCQFHQVEGLYIDEGVSFADMKQTLLYFAQEMFGAAKIRLRPSFFPFTEPSAEMDVWLGTETDKARRLTKGTGWLEILGCGMVDPQVLENCGIDSAQYSGFAFGMGIERQALQLFDISDIRLLFESDVRFLKQFSGAI